MKPGKRNLEITRGDDYPHEIRFEDSAGDPVDKSGCTYRAQIRTRAADEDDIAFDIDDSQLAGGILVLSLDAAATRDLPTVAVWDLEQTAPTPRTTTLLSGSVVVREDVTR